MTCISGWVYDVTGFYPASFFLAGTMSFLAALLFIPTLTCVKNKTQKQNTLGEEKSMLKCINNA